MMLHTNLIMYFEKAWLKKKKKDVIAAMSLYIINYHFPGVSHVLVVLSKQLILLVDLQRSCDDVEIQICIYNVYKL